MDDQEPPKGSASEAVVLSKRESLQRKGETHD